MIEDTLRRFLGEAYGFSGEISFVADVAQGALSHNVIIRDGQRKFFLKRYSVPIERLPGIHRTKFFFSEGGIPVVLPIRSRTGATWVEFLGFSYALFPFVEGNQFPLLGMNSAALRSAGECLARMHRLSREILPEGIATRSLGWDRSVFLQKIADLIPLIEEKKQKTDFDVMALETLIRQKHLAERTSKRPEDFSLGQYHILHGDWLPGNIFFDETDNVRWVFDLELANCAPRVLEVIRFIDMACFSDEFSEASFTRAQAFLSAYQDVYPLPPSVLGEGLRYWFYDQIHSSWLFREYYVNHNPRVGVFLKRYRAFFEYHDQNLDAYVERLVGMIS